MQILRTAAEGGAEARFINQLLQLNADEAQACTESYNKALGKMRLLHDDTFSQGTAEPPLLRCAITDPRTPLNCPVPTNLKEGLATEAGSHTTSSKVQVKGSVRTATAGSSVAPVLCTSGPRFARPMPPLMQPLQEETCPVLPSIADSLLWDDSSEVSPSQVAAIQQQLAEAQCKPLQPLQHKELILALVRSPFTGSVSALKLCGPFSDVLCDAGFMASHSSSHWVLPGPTTSPCRAQQPDCGRIAAEAHEHELPTG